MTRDDLIQKLAEILDRHGSDPKADHIEADDALLSYINDKRVTELYIAIKKWYA
jgi:hypothetical protein